MLYTSRVLPCRDKNHNRHLCECDDSIFSVCLRDPKQKEWVPFAEDLVYLQKDPKGFCPS